jgi:hypothetical protein
VVEFTFTGTYVADGTPVIFGNGTTLRIRSASGDCITPALVGPPGGLPPPLPPFPTAPTEPPATPQSPVPVNTVPRVNTVPGTGTIVPSL